MTKTLLIIAAALSLTGCASVAAPATTSADLGGSYTLKKDNPAKGTKTCTVNQITSNYLKANGDGYGSSILFADVNRDGSIGLAVTEDTYPGTKAYFLVDGHRYSGDGENYVTVPAAAMIAESVVSYTYTDWPYGGDHSGEDVLGKFKAAYDDCLAFLRGS